MILIEVSKIGESGSKTWTGEEPAAMLELEHDPLVRPEGPVVYELTAEILDTEILVRGTIHTTLTVRCARCAQIFSTIVKVSSFLHAYERKAHLDGIDVTEDVREEIMLEIPAFLLCREDCKGLCAQCGQDLNEGLCGCGSNDGFSPFSALNGLKLESSPDGE